MRAIRTSGLTSGDWKRSNGPRNRGTGARRKPPDNGYSSGPTATAPVVDSTAGPGRQMMHDDVDAQLVGKVLQLTLPEPQARAVASAAIGGDHQPRGVRVASAADLGPPAADRLHGERRGVVVHADADPSGIGREIVDAIRHRPAQVLDQEVMHPDLLWLAPRTPRLTGILEVAHKLLLLGIHRDHRLPAASAALTLSLMWMNCAFRSGWLSPSRVLRLACRLNFCLCSNSPTTVRPIR